MINFQQVSNPTKGNGITQMLNVKHMHNLQDQGLISLIEAKELNSFKNNALF